MNQDIYNRGIDLFRRIWINWVRMTHICVGKLTIIGSDNGLAPGQRQTIIWTNDGILLIGPQGTNFSGIWPKFIEGNTFASVCEMLCI